MGRKGEKLVSPVEGLSAFLNLWVDDEDLAVRFGLAE